jgi:hypothetical protein
MSSSRAVLTLSHIAVRFGGIAALSGARLQADRLQRWTFLFVLVGWRLRGGTGSPANPLAIL